MEPKVKKAKVERVKATPRRSRVQEDAEVEAEPSSPPPNFEIEDDVATDIEMSLFSGK